MGYNFNTIDGLFRPNYQVYTSPSNDSETESKPVKPMLVTYYPQNVERIKSILAEALANTYKQEEAEVPNNEQQEPQEQQEQETQNDNTEVTPDQDRFMFELNKFITNNPEYKGIKKELQYLAELESSYKLDAANAAGSTALGWFQFIDSTRNAYSKQTREQFAKDPQAQLLAAAKYYTELQNEVRRRGGDPKDFTTMYGAWWRPESAYAYLNNSNHDFKTKYNESFKQITQRARNLVSKYEKGNS